MLNLNDSIRLRNVITRKYRFHYKDMETYLAHFMEDVNRTGATIKGPLIYSLHNVPMDEIMHVEFLMPVHEEQVPIMDDMSFHSYFWIDNMISVYDLGQYEASTEVAYAALIHHMETKYLRQATPIFHVVSGDRSLPYTHIKVGVAAMTHNEIWN